MHINLIVPSASNFEAIGKDLNGVLMKLFSNQNLLKLLKYTTPDALDRPDLTPVEIKALRNDNIRVVPKLPLSDERGSYIVIMFDNFIPNITNPEYRDNLITFDILCDTENWLMDDYMLRPYKIMHEIDSMFNKQKLNGIGKIEYVSGNSLIIGDLAGYTLTYRVINDI